MRCVAAALELITHDWVPSHDSPHCPSLRLGNCWPQLTNDRGGCARVANDYCKYNTYILLILIGIIIL